MIFVKKLMTILRISFKLIKCIIAFSFYFCWICLVCRVCLSVVMVCWWVSVVECRLLIVMWCCCWLSCDAVVGCHVMLLLVVMWCCCWLLLVPGCQLLTVDCWLLVSFFPLCFHCQWPALLLFKHSRSRIFKRLWGPGIDSKEWIPPEISPSSLLLNVTRFFL